MRIIITSPQTFKTCYIAQMKEEVGLPVRTAPNRAGSKRMIQTPKHLKKYIKKAILALMEKRKEVPTYREIQQKAFELYKMDHQLEGNKFLGIIKIDDVKWAKGIIEDEQIYYAD